MNAEFDSGAVLTRARPVLTFTSVDAPKATRPMRPRAETPTPPGVTVSDMAVTRAKPAKGASGLPVIPRIVRRTTITDSKVLKPIVRAATIAKRAGIGSLVVAALGLATLGSIAGLGMRSLSDEATTAPAAASPATGMVHVADATASERLLARAPLPVRVDHVAPPVDRVTPPVHVDPPRLAHAAPPHPKTAPSHLTFTASHHAAATAKHSSSSQLARR
jgi:hypothetical protein